MLKYKDNLLLILFFLIFFLLSWIRHYSFDSSSFDMGIYVQYLQNLDSYSVIRESYLLNDHLSFTFLLLKLFVKFIDPAIVLLASQAFSISLALYFGFQYKKTLLVYTLLILYPPLHYAVGFDFHQLTFSVGFISGFIYFYKKNNFKFSLLFLLLSIFSQEDIAFYLFAFLLFENFKYRNTYLIITGFYIVLTSLLLFTSNSYVYSITSFLITPNLLITSFTLCLPLLIIHKYRVYLFIVMLNLFFRILSGREMLQYPYFHYSIIVIPFLVYYFDTRVKFLKLGSYIICTFILFYFYPSFIFKIPEYLIRLNNSTVIHNSLSKLSLENGSLTSVDHLTPHLGGRSSRISGSITTDKFLTFKDDYYLTSDDKLLLLENQANLTKNYTILFIDQNLVLFQRNL